MQQIGDGDDQTWRSRWLIDRPDPRPGNRRVQLAGVKSAFGVAPQWRRAVTRDPGPE
jgi:hypothetical protein